MRLTAELPPRTLPRFCGITRLRTFGCAVVVKFQSRGVPSAVPWYYQIGASEMGFIPCSMVYKSSDLLFHHLQLQVQWSYHLVSSDSTSKQMLIQLCHHQQQSILVSMNIYLHLVRTKSYISVTSRQLPTVACAITLDSGSRNNKVRNISTCMWRLLCHKIASSAGMIWVLFCCISESPSVRWIAGVKTNASSVPDRHDRPLFEQVLILVVRKTA